MYLNDILTPSRLFRIQQSNITLNSADNISIIMQDNKVSPEGETTIPWAFSPDTDLSDCCSEMNHDMENKDKKKEMTKKKTTDANVPEEILVAANLEQQGKFNDPSRDSDDEESIDLVGKARAIEEHNRQIALRELQERERLMEEARVAEEERELYEAEQKGLRAANAKKKPTNKKSKPPTKKRNDDDDDDDNATKATKSRGLLSDVNRILN
jgi:hypothetical protein